MNNIDSSKLYERDRVLEQLIVTDTVIGNIKRFMNMLEENEYVLRT